MFLESYYLQMPTTKIKNFLLSHNRSEAEAYANPEAVRIRREYCEHHPTEILALTCMDGRLNFPEVTNTPVGIAKTFRNLGGDFDLGWPFFGSLFQQWVDDAMGRGHDAIIIAAYHYSKSDTHLGCAGWGCDTDKAKAASMKLQAQCARVLGGGRSTVYPIVIGFETDEDELIVHGKDGGEINIIEELETSEKDLEQKLRYLFSDMKEQMVRDLLQLLIGNIAHVKNVREGNRTQLETCHGEQIMGIGCGLDWLHLHNKALLIGPFSLRLRKPFSEAAGILLENLNSGRIPKEDGVVVLISAVYHDQFGTEKNMASEKAHSLARMAEETIAERVPGLLPYVQFLVGVVDLDSREFSELDYKVEFNNIDTSKAVVEEKVSCY